MGISSKVIAAGKQFKVRLGRLDAEAPQVVFPLKEAEAPPIAPALPSAIAEKRECFNALARLAHAETARQFEEEQAQLDLFAPAKEKRVRRGAGNRNSPGAGAT